MKQNRDIEKRMNARVMKWREMIQKGAHSDQQLLIKRTRKGVPASIRIKVWPALVRVQKFIEKSPLTYSKVLLKDSYDIYDIKLDIPRTFSFQSQEILRESLFNVLKALSIEFPHVGYCQGMNFLVMRLLQILDDEIVFYIISFIIKKNKSICKNDGILDDNLRNPGFVNRQNQVFSKLFQQKLPKVSQKLKAQYIDPVMYTPSWFLTLFSKSLSKEKFYRFFECFLVEGYPVIFKTALALMKLKEKQFLQNQMEQNLLFVSDMDYYNKFDDDQFIQTIFSFEVSAIQITTIQKQYSYRNKNVMKKLQETVEKAYQKKVAEPRTTYEWSIEDYRKLNVGLIEFNDDE